TRQLDASGRSDCSRWYADQNCPAGLARRPRTQHPKDAIQHPPFINTRHATDFVRQHRSDDGPLIVRKFVAHDPSLRIEGLNHDLTADLNKASGTERTSAIGGEAEILLNQSITGFKAVATDESRLTRSRTLLDARASRPCCRNRHRPACGTKSSWVPAAVPHRDSTH